MSVGTVGQTARNGDAGDSGAVVACLAELTRRAERAGQHADPPVERAASTVETWVRTGASRETGVGPEELAEFVESVCDRALNPEYSVGHARLALIQAASNPLAARTFPLFLLIDNHIRGFLTFRAEDIDSSPGVPKIRIFRGELVLELLCVHPAARGRGFGERFVALAVSMAAV